MLRPTSCMVEYQLGAPGESLKCFASFDLGHLPAMGLDAKNQDEVRDDVFEGVDLSVALHRDGRKLDLTVNPRHGLVVTSCKLSFEREFFEDERVLFNGYQSWTDTTEHGVLESMPGLTKMNKLAIRHWVLDGSGDHNIVDYPNQPGIMHGWTYAYFRRGSACELIGSLDESLGMLMIGMDALEGEVCLEPECPNGWLSADHEIHVASLCVVAQQAEGEEAEQACIQDAFDSWFALSGVKARPASLLTGYSSWYRHYEEITEKKLLDDLTGACKAFAAIDACGHTKLFQIDDGYTQVGDWLEIDDQAFPHGLAPLAKTISSVGFVPGLWMAPFLCEKDSRVAHDHPEWLLRDAVGNTVATGSHWSGGLALDTRNPEVRDYVTTCLRTVTQEWGFKLLKLDFLYAACMVPHDGMNRGQLMADAMSLLRQAAGEDTLILGCGVPLGAAFGVVDYCRIGCDVGLDWDGKLYMRRTGRERVSTRNSIRNTVFRGPLNGRAFANDPDVVLLRSDVELTDDQRAMVVHGDACFSSMLLTSDDMGQWNEDQLRLFQEALKLQQVANA